MHIGFLTFAIPGLSTLSSNSAAASLQQLMMVLLLPGEQLLRVETFMHGIFGLPPAISSSTSLLPGWSASCGGPSAHLLSPEVTRCHDFLQVANAMGARFFRDQEDVETGSNSSPIGRWALARAGLQPCCPSRSYTA